MKKARAMAAAPTGEPKRCAIYTRKSVAAGLEQQFNSLDAQREACAAYVQRQPGWTLVGEGYDDGGFSGATTERPAFQRLLADIEAKKVDVVVVYKVDRLSRSLLDFAKVMERFSAAGTSFVSVTQNFSTADAMGRLTLNMLMSFAEFEREMIAERTRDKVTAARRRGKWTGGPVPLGYTVQEKRLVVDELEAVVVREAFSLYLEHRSAHAVARMLNERNRSTKRHRAANGNLRESRGWTKADVVRLLKNAVYAGYMPCGAELHDGEHDAVVPRETFSRVRTLLRDATVAKKDHGRNPDYILRGLLRCARCGAAFTPASTRKSGIEYRYYRCVTRDKRGKEACPSAPLPANAIEAFVLEQLQGVVADGALATDVAAGVEERTRARKRDILTERQKLPAQIASLSDEGKRLVESLATVGAGARRLLDQRLSEVGEQLARCEDQLALAERELVNLDALEVEAGWVRECLTDFDKIWDVLTPANRGRLLRAVVQRVEVDEPANQVSVHITDISQAMDTPLETGQLAREEATQ